MMASCPQEADKLRVTHTPAAGRHPRRWPPRALVKSPPRLRTPGGRDRRPERCAEGASSLQRWAVQGPRTQKKAASRRIESTVGASVVEACCCGVRRTPLYVRRPGSKHRPARPGGGPGCSPRPCPTRSDRAGSLVRPMRSTGALQTTALTSRPLPNTHHRHPRAGPGRISEVVGGRGVGPGAGGGQPATAAPGLPCVVW